MAGLLGDFLSWVDTKKRNAANTARGLLTDPAQELAQMGSYAMEPFAALRNAAQGWQIGAPETPEKEAARKAMFNAGMSTGLLGPLTFAGVGAKTADKVALQKAKQMANVGDDPVKIWQTTGWTEQFPDKKWRFEIPDNTAKINPKTMHDIELSKMYLNKNPVTDADIRHMQSLKDQWPAAQFMNHGQLFQNYPELMGGTVRLDANMRPGQGAFAGEAAGQVGGDIGLGLATEPTMRSVGMHELQHAIQQREGFARGGSPDQFYLDPKFPKFALSEQLAKSRGLDWESLPKKQKNAITNEVLMEQYRRLAGEAEARLTQSRMNLTPAERMQRPPWMEFDVPPEKQIVRGLLGSN